MGQWFSDNLWVLVAIGVVVVFMVAYMAFELYRAKRNRAAAAKAKRQAAPLPSLPAGAAESHMDIGFAVVGGRRVLVVTLNSAQDLQTLGRLMPMLGDGADIAVVKSDFVGANLLKNVGPGVWAVRSGSEDDWVALRTEDVLSRLGKKDG
jgi:hypothetical protein